MSKIISHTDVLQYLNTIPGFKSNARLLLAVSGGRDSMVMTSLFQQCNFDIAIAHINFSLRGSESDADAAFVQSFASAAEIPFYQTKFDTKKFASTNHLSIEEAARKLRYDWLEEISVAHQYDFIATAHHLNDHAETLLMHLTTGAGLMGMHGIRALNGKIIRPLLFASGAQIESYAVQQQITYRTDSTNADEQFVRNKIRKHIIPLLQEINPAFLDTMAGNAKRFSEEYALSSERANQIIRKWIKQLPYGTAMPIKPIQSHQSATTLLHFWLSPCGFNAAQIADLVHHQHVSGKQFLSKTHRLIVDRKHYLLTANNAAEISPVYIHETDKKIPFAGGHLEISFFDMPSGLHTTSQPDILYLDASAISFPLMLRVWQRGDYMYPAGLYKRDSCIPARKKISDLLTEAKIAIPQKERTFVLCSGEQIYWLVGIRASEKCKIKKTTRKVIKIKMLPE